MIFELIGLCLFIFAFVYLLYTINTTNFCESLQLITVLRIILISILILLSAFLI